MNNNSPAQSIINSLVEHRRWWLIPTLVITVAAIFYALFSEKSYTSRQSMVIRDDLVGTFFKPGRFDSLDSLKSAQETLLEISRRPQVVRAALKQLGPTFGKSEAAWLGDENLEKMQGKIQISAPNGAEFGRTETIVLSVQQNSRDRAGKFVTYLLDEIENSLRNLRSNQFASMQQELAEAASVAEASYLGAASKLESFESKIGADLSTLRSLNDAQAGTNNLQSQLANLNIEKRQARSETERVRKQIQLLSNIAQRPDSILEVPQELLQLQPTLASLAKGLNDAILTYSKSKGRYQTEHPKVREDFRAVTDIKERIKSKLTRTLGSLASQLELRQGNLERISNIIADKEGRLTELSGMRVGYATLLQDVDKKRGHYAKTQASLSEIVTLGTSAKKVSLISRIDQPQTELYPDGPSNKAIVFGGMIAGLMIGFGLVLFISPIDGPSTPAPLASQPQTGPSQNHNDPSSYSDGQTIQRATHGGIVSSAFSSDGSDAAPNLAPIQQPVENNPVSATTKIDPVTDSTTQDPVASESYPENPQPVPQIEKPKSIEVPQVPTTAETNTSIPDTPLLTPSIPETGKHQPSGSPQPEFDSFNDLSTKSPAETPPIQQSPFVSPSVEPQTNFETSDDLETTAMALQPPTQEPSPISTESEQPTSVEEKPELEGKIIEFGAPTQDSEEIPDANDSIGEKTASEIAAEITGSLMSKSPKRFGEEIQQRDDLFSEAVVSDQNESVSQYSSLIDKAQQAAEDYLGSEQHDKASTNFDTPQIPSSSQSSTLDTPDNQLNSEQDIASAGMNFSASTSQTIQQHDTQEGDQDIEGGPVEGVFSKLYENGTAQILEPAELNIPEINAEIDDLRIGKSDSKLLSEKLNQFQQNELETENTRKTPVPSITPNAVDDTTGQADEPPFADTTETPLTTSIDNSSIVTSGYESVPQTGNQPEDRPTATTVDLRMLKEQLAGKVRQESQARPLSEILGQNVHESDAPDLSVQEKVDTNITDLANSIRDICQRQDQDEQ